MNDKHKLISLYPVYSPDGGGMRDELVGYALDKQTADNEVLRIKKSWNASVRPAVQGIIVDGTIYTIDKEINNAITINDKIYELRKVTNIL